MNTNMKENNMNELNFSEMEQANGGILPILLVNVASYQSPGFLIFATLYLCEW